MDEQTYYAIARWLTIRTEMALESRRDVPPPVKTDDSDPQSEGMEGAL